MQSEKSHIPPLHREEESHVVPETTIVAIGDLHGHEPALNQLLASLQSRYGIFGNRNADKLRSGVTLVFTGDYIDRGTSALAIIEKLRKLGRTNPGRIITLLGNHELLALEAFDDARKLAEQGSPEGAMQKYLSRTWHGQNGGNHFVREFGQRIRNWLLLLENRSARSELTLPSLKSTASAMSEPERTSLPELSSRSPTATGRIFELSIARNRRSKNHTWTPYVNPFWRWVVEAASLGRPRQ